MERGTPPGRVHFGLVQWLLALWASVFYELQVSELSWQRGHYFSSDVREATCGP